MLVTIEHSAILETKVTCNACGHELSATFDSHYDYSGRSINDLEVEPCNNCLERERQEGYDTGYSDGENTAMSKFEQLNESN